MTPLRSPVRHAGLTTSCGFRRHKYDDPITKDTKQPDMVLFDKAISDIEHSRFEIARIIGAGNAALFDPEDGGAAGTVGFPQLANRLYFEAVEPFLATHTKAALDRANSQQEWNTFLLSSPEFNYE